MLIDVSQLGVLAIVDVQLPVFCLAGVQDLPPHSLVGDQVVLEQAPIILQENYPPYLPRLFVEEN